MSPPLVKTNIKMKGLERAVPPAGSLLKFEVSSILKVLLDR